MVRPILENALIEELAKVGIPEPKRIYRPAIMARNSLDGTDEGLDRVHKRLITTFPFLDSELTRGTSTLYDWNIVSNGLKAQYSVRERKYNADFSMPGVNEIIGKGLYDEEFAIAEEQFGNTRRGNDIIICAARDNGEFRVVMAENLGKRYDISAISKLQKEANNSIEEFAKQVAKLFRGKK